MGTITEATTCTKAGGGYFRPKKGYNMGTFDYPTHADVKSVYADTDSALVTKLALNSIYGKAVRDMIHERQHIVVHSNNDEYGVGIIFQDSINAVLRRESGALLVVNGQWISVTDKYSDIIKKLI